MWFLCIHKDEVFTVDSETYFQVKCVFRHRHICNINVLQGIEGHSGSAQIVDTSLKWSVGEQPKLCVHY